MKTCLRICEGDYTTIFKHLFPGDGKEAIAFALCGRAQSEGRLVFTVHEVMTIPYNHCIREEDYLHWQTEDVLPIMNKAMNSNMAIMRIHSHPGGWPHFSEYDLRTDRDFFGDLMKGWCEDSLPHLSAIMMPDRKIIGRVYHANGRVHSLDSAIVVGDTIANIIFEEEFEDVPPDEAIRNIQAFGEGTYNTLKKLRIGVVGCSGTGCHVIEQLMRLQVGELVLVDPDVIEGKNLNRLVGASKKDIGTPKTIFYKRYIKHTGLGVKVLAYQDDLFQSQSAIKALSTCDVLFGCVDSASGRLLMNSIATFYNVPFFDMGVRLDADGKGGVSYIGAQIDYLQPGKSSLKTRGVIKQEEVDAETERLFTPEMYEQHIKEDYIKNVKVDRPAVISVNGYDAYSAVLILLDKLIGFRHEQQYGQIITTLCEDLFIKTVETDFPVDDYLKKYKGRGDMVPCLDMPLFNN